METRLDKEGFESLYGDLQFQNKIIVKQPNTGGGLALLWKNDKVMELINYSPNHILMKVTEEDGFVWFFTGFYGWPEAQNKEKSWQLLKHLRSFVNGAWLCAGDFNAILHSTEKLSVRPPNSAEIDAFRSGLDSCNFKDLGFRGYTYTWSNKRPGEANTKLRLDRAVATMEWQTKFQMSTVSHLPPHASDHLPILVHVKSVQRHQQKFRKGFKFEEAWLLWEDCGDVVKEAWEMVGGGDSGLASIKEKIKFCGEKLKTWGSSKLEPNEAAMKVLQNRLEVLNSAEVVTDESKVEYLSVSKQLDDLLLKQEIYWAQRSRILWLKHGDKNTKFFHSKASQRRRKNFIKGIQCTQGNWVDEEEEIAKVATDYFDNLFCAGTCDQMEECLNAVPRKVSPDMQGTLSSEFSAEEIKIALFQMGPTKAPGPDGMNALFYQRFWHVVGDTVVDAVLDFLNNGHMLPDINHTYIVLIPKVKNPEKMSDFRPISLCNVIYKIISKVLANRLKQVLPNIISPTQSAFIPGRLITDNVLLAYETLHTMHCRKKGKKGCMALKLDVSKAYDRVEWPFLKGVMQRLGYPETWIERVMSCVTTTSFSILVNGKPYVYFSNNTTGRQKQEALEILVVKEVSRFESYLGLPTLVGRAKYHTFSFIKDRVWKKLQGWKGMLLSRAGKEVLIKVVAQSIPTYTMSVFQIPSKLCDELDALCARFWWGQFGNERKIHWKSWDKLTLSKKDGGMGFRDLRSFNLVMLAKQGWRLLKDTNSLLYQCFKARYFPRTSILEATESPNCSFVWRSLVAALPVLRTGHCWRVGDGFSINVYRDRWIPNYPTNKPLSSVRVDEEEVLVSSLINHDLQVWRRDFIMANFNREEGEAICDILLSRRHVPDSVYWKHSKDGNFTLKSAYKVAKSLLKKEDWAGSSSGGGVSRVWAAIWKLRIPNKMKVFGWRACHDILPTRRNLKKKRVLLDELCPLCSRVQESTIHALRECEAAQDIWHGSARALQKCGTGQTDFITLLEYLLDRMEKTEVELMIVQAWLIWNQRNRVVHGGKFMDPGWLNK
ncbi:hypothetical protein SO802_028653 [Lithocarpus litseifolius]|uniref:Reverse transcriptase domain-containing protein n=1 Tax=Lithocarpus litseifolius TaxID=425828 RepID=A0AAW2BUG2_9ROSI